MSASYTCINCAVAFKDPDMQREHYKTDWHRYNLKRKVAELAPVTLAQFTVRLEKQKQVVSEENQKAAAGKVGYCVACSKNFSTEKAYVNHVKSRKHLEAQEAFDGRSDINQEELRNNRKNRRMELEAEAAEKQKQCEEEEDEAMDDEDIEEVDSDEWDEDDSEEGDPIPLSDCLFCSHHSASLDKNLVHMTSDHSFFLPDADYIVDLEGLLTYLGAKVGQGHMCLWCNHKGKAFRDTAAVQKHMVAKGHSKILHDTTTLAEFADFYDYSSSYPDGTDRDPEEGVDPDVEVDVDRIDDAGYELVLPSGARIGHRSLMRYYRQGAPAERSVAVRNGHISHGKSGLSSGVLGVYRSHGWVGSGLTPAQVKSKAADLKYMRRVQMKAWMGLGTRANKLQKHWRDPTMLY